MTEKFSVYVTGDSGTDTYTLYEEGTRLVRPTLAALRGDTAYDLHIHSGAAFMELALTRVLQSSKDIKVTLMAPKRVDKPANEKDMQDFKSLNPILTQIKRVDKEKYRIWRFTTLDDPRDGKGPNTVWVPQVPQDPGDKSLLVVADCGTKWNTDGTKSTAEKLPCFYKRLIEKFTNGRDAQHAKQLAVVVNVKELPELPEQPSARTFQSHFWNELEQHSDQVGIVVSLATLRRAGAAISSRLSWEQTVEDITAEMHLFPKLKALSQFRHLFIRVDLTGLVHIENTQEPSAKQGWLYFAPYADDAIHRDWEFEGCVIGKNTLLVARLVQNIKNGGKSEVPFEPAVKYAIRTIMKIDDTGYPSSDLPGTNADGNKLIQSSIGDAKTFQECESEENINFKERIVSCRIPRYLLTALSPSERRSTERWHILDDLLERAPVPRINIAIAIVQWGLRDVLNQFWKKNETMEGSQKDIWRTLTCPDFLDPRERTYEHITLEEGKRPAMPQPYPVAQEMPKLLQQCEIDKGFDLNVPVATFGKLTAAEREEIEGLYSISNLLKLYIREREQNRKPVSVAVFGPPGTGKSFTVKQIVETLTPDKKIIDTIEYNVAQFQTPDDLSYPLIKATSINSQGKIPIVFFDEFDCNLDSKPLGWLKYFLAPMQDGTFYGARQTIDIGRAIFVFAGGTHDSFEKFDPRSVPAEDDEHTKRLTEFRQQKGPDFISRLRGHINVLPINAKPGDRKHYIRRAVLLRSLLENRGFTYPKHAKSMAAMVDDAVTYALLTIDNYHHGARSMEAILQMCTPIYGRIEIASLPAREQLNMHVDAENFFIRVYRGRSKFLYAQSKEQSSVGPRSSPDRSSSAIDPPLTAPAE